MSLFRKPTKRIQRRVFEAADDEDEGDPEPPPPPIISREQRETKSVKNTPLLSFADEEEESEVFKVKKSTQSKRFSRRREKERKKTTNTDIRLDEPSTEENAMDVDEHVNLIDKPKKRVTLEGLILSGREALAADGAGDISDDNNDQEEPDEEQRGFHQFRAESVRAALAVAAAPGHIPDAALIHAARKTRQQARELGEYVPIRDDDGGSRTAGGSRLIQDDGSGDDEDEGRLHVRGLDLPSDKPKRGTTTTISSDVEADSESEQWEEQQLQKAMPALNDIIGAESGPDLNPFAVAPPPPRLEDAPAHLRPLAEPGVPPPATPSELVQALQERLRHLHQAREVTMGRYKELRERLLQRARVHERCTARSAPLDAAYRRAQAIRGYLTDLIECLDEKLPQLETLEARALSMHRRRCEFLQERRRADVRDQAHDVLTAGRTGGARPPDYEAKIRRAAEREGRRRARRLKREAAVAGALNHRDGDSSDDELPPAERQHVEHEEVN
ncbi:PAX3- and PAX7-binding protein 1 [Eumeta japonica]|uniref:PAX3-and PAX7-binding protein 1 n=1 Tax=Eumeta variegata TaxID=151549 RepID=A0A4C2A1Y2_EUMVA|nr:PAX3- and PAX7-binding protein 1 [Eumeta japonica]